MTKSTCWIFKRADIIDFRQDLLVQEISKNNINGTIKAIKVILAEAFYREDIPDNPASMVAKLNPNNKEAGTLTKEELVRLFKLEPVR